MNLAQWPAQGCAPVDLIYSNREACIEVISVRSQLFAFVMGNFLSFFCNSFVDLALLETGAAKPQLHSAKALPSVTLGKDHSVKK
jgi:hypothetical protein